MKDFKDNLEEEENIENKKESYEHPMPKTHRTFWRKLLKGLSRYSLLVIVGLAALSITFLHFKGKHLLTILKGTPIPTFFLEKMIAPKPLPDKTKVYEETLKEEEKQLRQKRSLHSSPIQPQWQDSYLTGNTKTNAQVGVQDTVVEKTEPLAHTDTVKHTKPQITLKRKMRKHKPRQRKPASQEQKITTKKEAVIDFFQSVKVANPSTKNNFIPCTVHGGQEVSNNQMLALRLTKDIMVNGQQVPSGTLIYGTVRLAQNRIQVSVSRVLQFAVQYRVHDHTYHEGVLLDETQKIWEDASQETAYRQGQRSIRKLPIDIAVELGRNVLQGSKRKQSTVYLPDGYPLYLVNQKPSTP